jgi:hypothetical protein
MDPAADGDGDFRGSLPKGPCGASEALLVDDRLMRGKVRGSLRHARCRQISGVPTTRIGRRPILRPVNAESRSGLIRSATSIPTSIRSISPSRRTTSTSSAGCSARKIGRLGITRRRAKVTAAQMRRRPDRGCGRAARGKFRLLGFLDRPFGALLKTSARLGWRQTVRRTQQQTHAEAILELGNRLREAGLPRRSCLAAPEKDPVSMTRAKASIAASRSIFIPSWNKAYHFGDVTKSGRAILRRLRVTTRKCSESTASWTKHERAVPWYVRCTFDARRSGGGRRHDSDVPKAVKRRAARGNAGNWVDHYA